MLADGRGEMVQREWREVERSIGEGEQLSGIEVLRLRSIGFKGSRTFPR
jgi:hypothetical protein